MGDIEHCALNIPEMKELAEQLSCGVCYELMKSPMMTACSHTFCSLCIRSSISYKAICPTCSSAVHDENLKRNHTVENVIDIFIRMTANVTNFVNKCKCISNISPKTAKENPEHSACTPSTSKMAPSVSFNNPRASKSSEDPFTTPNHKGKHREMKTPSNKHKPLSFNVSSTSKSTAAVSSDDSEDDFEPSMSLKHGKGKKPANPKSVESPAASAQNKVVCPVCSVEQLERHINAHLDACLSSGGKTISAESSISGTSSSVKFLISKENTDRNLPLHVERKKLPKKVYDVMSDKELRKDLKSHGLSTAGDRHALQKRLKRYVVLFNSECDSLNPRPIADIRLSLEKEEKTLTTPLTMTSVSKVFRTVRNPHPVEVENACKEYLRDNKSSYDSLIRQIRERTANKVGCDNTSGSDASPTKSETNMSTPGKTSSSIGNDSAARINLVESDLQSSGTANEDCEINGRFSPVVHSSRPQTRAKREQKRKRAVEEEPEPRMTRKQTRSKTLTKPESPKSVQRKSSRINSSESSLDSVSFSPLSEEFLPSQLSRSPEVSQLVSKGETDGESTDFDE